MALIRECLGVFLLGFQLSDVKNNLTAKNTECSHRAAEVHFGQTIVERAAEGIRANVKFECS